MSKAKWHKTEANLIESAGKTITTINVGTDISKDARNISLYVVRVFLSLTLRESARNIRLKAIMNAA